MGKITPLTSMRFLLSTLLLIITFFGSAQNILISGEVSDTILIPIPSTSVILKTNSNQIIAYTYSDEKGYYQLKFDKLQTLVLMNFKMKRASYNYLPFKKIKMKIKFTFIFLVVNTIYSQSIFVEYNIEKLNNTLNGVLIANNSYSYFKSSLLQKTNTDTISMVDSNTFFIKPKKLIIPERRYYGTYNDNKMHVVINQPKRKTIIALDSIPDFIWKIDNSKIKKILGYDCIKASTNFRGTDIVAYFTTEIPYPYGPFKFKDLPGLILEVYNINENDNFHWSAIRIKYPYEVNETKLKFNPLDYNVDIYTLEELIKKFETKAGDKGRLKSISPRGTTINRRLIRKRVEKVYEWEK